MFCAQASAQPHAISLAPNDEDGTPSPLETPVVIGRGCYGVHHLRILHWTTPGVAVILGQFVSIAPEVTILLDGNHDSSAITTYPLVGPDERGGDHDVDVGSKGSVYIGNGSWVGWGATILSGVKIGDGAVIGAQAVVANDIPPYTIAVGNPARVVKSRWDPERTEQISKELRFWEWDAERILKHGEALMSRDVAGLVSALAEEQG